MKRQFTILKSTLSILLLSAVVYLFTGCEKELEFNYEKRGEFRHIVINGFASPGEPFSVSVTESRLRFYWFDGDPDMLTIKDAQEARLTVNGDKTYDLMLDSIMYRCDYVVQCGDHLRVDFTDNQGQKASAEVNVPTVPSLEVLDVTCEYSPKDTWNNYGNHPINDTLFHVKLRIHDPSPERNFFRLYTKAHLKGSTFRPGVDIETGEPKPEDDRWVDCSSDWEGFETTDPVLYDAQLTSATVNWNPHVTNIFDDHLFDGATRDVIVSFRPRYIFNGTDVKTIHVNVQLQQLDETYYFYNRALMRFQRLPTYSQTQESITFPSNVSTGWGILGAVVPSELVTLRIR